MKRLKSASDRQRSSCNPLPHLTHILYHKRKRMSSIFKGFEKNILNYFGGIILDRSFSVTFYRFRQNHPQCKKSSSIIFDRTGIQIITRSFYHFRQRFNKFSHTAMPLSWLNLQTILVLVDQYYSTIYQKAYRHFQFWLQSRLLSVQQTHIQ